MTVTGLVNVNLESAETSKVKLPPGFLLPEPDLLKPINARPTTSMPSRAHLEVPPPPKLLGHGTSDCPGVQPPSQVSPGTFLYAFARKVPLQLEGTNLAGIISCPPKTHSCEPSFLTN